MKSFNGKWRSNRSLRQDVQITRSSTLKSMWIEIENLFHKTTNSRCKDLSLTKSIDLGKESSRNQSRGRKKGLQRNLSASKSQVRTTSLRSCEELAVCLRLKCTLTMNRNDRLTSEPNPCLKEVCNTRVPLEIRMLSNNIRRTCLQQQPNFRRIPRLPALSRERGTRCSYPPGATPIKTYPRDLISVASKPPHSVRKKQKIWPDRERHPNRMMQIGSAQPIGSRALRRPANSLLVHQNQTTLAEKFGLKTI